MADMKFMPMFKDSLSAMSRLNYEERGRLVTAMLAYFFDGDDPEEIATGRESMLIDLMISRLDMSKDNAKKLSETRSNARKGISQQKDQMSTNDIKSQQKEQMISNVDFDDTCRYKEKDKEKEKEKDKDKYIYKGGSRGGKQSDFKDVLDDSDLTDPVKDTLQDFIKMRKNIKKPMTAYALKLLIGRLKKLSDSEDMQIEILNQSILHSWQDVYELKTDSGGGYTKSRDKPNLALEYQQRDYKDGDLDKYFMDLGGGGG